MLVIKKKTCYIYIGKARKNETIVPSKFPFKNAYNLGKLSQSIYL